MLAPASVKVKREESEESVLRLTPKLGYEEHDDEVLNFKLPEVKKEKKERKEKKEKKRMVTVKTERMDDRDRDRDRRDRDRDRVKRERDDVRVKRERRYPTPPRTLPRAHHKPPQSMQYRTCALHLDVLRAIGVKEESKLVLREVLRLLNNISIVFKSEIIVLLKLVELIVSKHGTMGLNKWCESLLVDLQKAFSEKNREDGASLCASTLQFVRSASRTRCFKCGEMGHTAALCPSQPMDVDSSRPTPPESLNARVGPRHCHRCGEPGHISQYCPNRRGPDTRARMDVDR